MEASYLSELNESQRQAVEQLDGPVMIIAGAGSGKTRVLTYRIGHLINRGTDAFSILALTFTKKAATEMKKRIGEMVGSSLAKNLWMGTFHAVFARILRSEADKIGYPQNFTIYDTQDSQRLISSIIKEMNLDKEVYKYKRIYSRISSYKNNLITVKSYFNNQELMEKDAIAKQPKMGDIYKAYVDRCFKAGAMDFDDLLLRTNELLSKFPEVLMKYQDRFRYIMVDEYQDTNRSQYLIVRALADRFQNICVVGDDSQSIYAFRGANINNILNFKKDYTDTKTFRLEQNYRSTKNLVNAANAVIKKNKNRLDKEVWTHNEDGTFIKVHQSPTDADEGRFVAQNIQTEAIENQLEFGDFAILYRTNAQSRALEDALRKREIPYRIYGGQSFYQRKEIKDVLAYLRLIINPNDEEALMRVINYPARGIGATTISKLVVTANHYNKSIFEILTRIQQIDMKMNASTKNRLYNFMLMVQSLQVQANTQNAFTITETVLKESGLVQELKKDGSLEGIGRIQNVEELLNGIKDFVAGQKEINDAKGSIAEYLEDVALSTDSDKDRGNDNVVSLMTIHLSKGLEFPYLYIVGIEENLFPSARSMNTREELEEERRLFYVALTRAEKQAYLTYAETRYQWGNLNDVEPSRFISEIPEEYLEYLTPKNSASNFRSRLHSDMFDEVDKSQFRQKKPVNNIKAISQNNATPSRQLRKVKPNEISRKTSEELNISLNVGMQIEHQRFGRGNIISIEGKGGDRKIEIQFQKGGIKKLILKFAKFEIIKNS